MDSSRPFNVPDGADAGAGGAWGEGAASPAAAADVAAGKAALRSPVRTRSLGGGSAALPADSALRLAMAASRLLRADMRAEDMVSALSDVSLQICDQCAPAR